jgi:uncharacterized protein (TIGR03083 family)
VSERREPRIPASRERTIEPSDGVDPEACANAYRALRARVSDLVRNADPAALDAIAPATPEWRVRDVLAHMSGVNADIVNGNVGGVGTDDWTDAQVAARREWPIDDVLAEWETNATEVEANAVLLGKRAGQWVYDACTHEHDIRNALGAVGARDSDAVAIAFLWGTEWLGVGLDHAGKPGLAINTASGMHPVGTAEPRTTMTADRFEIIRAMVGRRSIAQIEAYGWDGEPRAEDLVLGIFAPRAVDLVE